MTRVLVHQAKRPEWPYGKAPETRTIELKPGERTSDDGWVILSVECQDDTAFTEDDAASANADAGLDDHGNVQWVTWPPDHELIVGHEYLIRTRTGQQRRERQHRMSFLGQDASAAFVQFNARPFAGTQTLHKHDIIATRDLGKSRGREDSKRYMNKIIRDEA